MHTSHQLPSPPTPGQEEDRAYLRRRRIVSIVSLLIFAGLVVWLGFAVGKPLIALASEPEKFREWMNAKGVWGRFLFLGIQILQVVIAVIPGEVIEIGAGYAFGAWEGALLCLAGAAAGSALIYGLTRLFGVRLVEAFVSREKIAEMKFMKNVQKRNALIFWIFFIPGTPKDLLTYFVGLTPMRLWTFLLISSVARIPSVLSSTLGGNALGRQDYRAAVVIFIVTALISGAGMLIYQKFSKKRSEKLSGKTVGDKHRKKKKKKRRS